MLNGRRWFRVRLEPDKAFKVIPIRKALDRVCPMFVDTADQIIRDADV